MRRSCSARASLILPSRCPSVSAMIPGLREEPEAVNRAAFASIATRRARSGRHPRCYCSSASGRGEAATLVLTLRTHWDDDRPALVGGRESELVAARQAVLPQQGSKRRY